MEYDQFVNDLTFYIHTAINDIDKLVEVADAIAQAEVVEYASKGMLRPPTTDPLGRPREVYTYIPSRCTVPLSMLCFSVIDFIGKLLDEGYERDEEGGADNFIRYSRSFFSVLANRSDLNGSAGSKFKDNYRNSIMHTFLPSSTKARGYSVSFTRMIDERTLFQNWGDEDILNVKCLSSITKAGLQKLEGVIKDKNASEILFKNYQIFIERSDERYRGENKKV